MLDVSLRNQRVKENQSVWSFKKSREQGIYDIIGNSCFISNKYLNKKAYYYLDPCPVSNVCRLYKVDRVKGN